MLSTHSSAPPKQYFPNLDGLRFVLAMVVLFGHSLFGATLISVIPFDFGKRLVEVFSSGSMAVSFFFTLSGYLITYLLIEEKELTGEFRIKKFYLRRILRIWPLYYTTLLITFFIYPMIKMKLGYANENPYHFLEQALFLSNFDNIRVDESGLIGVAPMMISINWSIAIEEQFYLFWPILFLLSGARKFWVVIVLTILFSLFFTTFILSGPKLYYHTFTRMADLALGALLGYLTFFNKTVVARVESMPRWLIVMIYSLGVLMLMYRQSWLWPFEGLMVSLFFVFIIVEQNFAGHSFYKFGNNKFLSSLGKYSYSLYLLHPLGIQASILTFRFLRLESETGFLYRMAYSLIALAAAMALSVFSYRFIESFFLRLKKRFEATL